MLPTTPVRVRSPLRWLLLAIGVAGIPARAQPTVSNVAMPPSVQPMAARGPAHFADRTANLPNEPITAIAVDPFDDALIYAGLDGFVFASDDGGDSWRPVLSFARGLADDGALNDTAVDAFDSGTNGQALDDAFADGAGGEAGALADEPLPEGDADEDDEDADRFVAADTDGGGGVDAADDPVDVIDTSVAPRIDAGVRAFAFVPGSRGVFLVATPRGVFRTTTAGASFERIRLPGGVRENDVRDIVVDPTRPSRLWIGTGAGLFFSPDGGASIVKATGRVGGIPIVDVAVDVVGAGRPPHLVVGTERGLLRSRDDGESFTEMLLQGVGAFPVVHAVAWVAESDTVYAGVAEGLFVARRGAPILERHQGLPPSPPAALSPDPLWPGGLAVALRGAAGGVVFSDDAGITLVDVDVLPARAPTALARERKDPTRLWVATERGVFRLQPGTGIRVGSDALAELRARFAREPDLATVTERVLRSHGMYHDDADLRERATVSSWLPRVELRYDVFRGDVNQTRNTFIFRDPSTLPPIIEDDDGNDLFGDGLLIVSPSQPFQQDFWVQLTWDLERLILNPQVLRSARQLPLLRNAERRLVDDTRQLYITRRRLIAELAAPASTLSPRDRVLRELRLQEVEAQLTGLADEDLFTPRRRIMKEDR